MIQIIMSFLLIIFRCDEQNIAKTPRQEVWMINMRVI